jgi:hypothetical protein
MRGGPALPDWLRRYLLCDCDIEVVWTDDGTVTGNLCCLGGHHHRLHHQGLLGIIGNADQVDGLVFTNKHGLVLDQAGRPRAPVPGEMPDVPAYQCPTGERLQKRSATP